MILAVSYSGNNGTAIGSLTVTTDSRVFTLTDDHKDFAAILQLLKDGKNDEAELRLDRATHVRAAVKDTKFAINGNVVTFEGRELPNVMAQYIIRLNTEGFDLAPLEKFTANLYQNPSFRAIQEAFRFIQANEMPITEDGCFIGYRAVTEDYKDIRTRTFDNSVGAVCEEPRNLVDENPDRTCSNGLHVCSLSYINGPGAGYGHPNSPWIIVKVNPRDVVAVPRDYKDTKLRCCRFEVVGELDRSKVAPKDTKSYRENTVVFKETDAELIKAGKFAALGEKHGKKALGGAYNPSPVSNFTSSNSYVDYMEAYDRIATGTGGPNVRLAADTAWRKANPLPVAKVTTVDYSKAGTNQCKARTLYNQGRFTDLMNFKKEKRVGFGRLGFTAAEEAEIEQKRNQNKAPTPALAAPVYKDALGYQVREPLRFDAHGYDQFGFRRTGKNRKGQTRGDFGVNKVTVAPAAAPTQPVVTLSKSAQYQQGFADGQKATSFLPTSTGTEYWAGFTAAWKTNPHNTNK